MAKSAAEMLIERGRLEGEQRGRQEGEQKGRLQGRQDLLLKAIALRFGKPSGEIEARVRQGTHEEVERWFEATLLANSADELLHTIRPTEP